MRQKLYFSFMTMVFFLTTSAFCLYMGHGSAPVSEILLWTTAYVMGWCFLMAGLQWVREHWIG